MKGRITFALLCTAVLAFACGPRTRSGDSLSSSASAARSATTRFARAHAKNGPALESSLDVTVGNGVHFDFRVTNVADRKVEVNFPNSQTHEMVVLDTLGREVWRWSSGRLFTQNLLNRVLSSDDTVDYEGRWSDAPPGRYTLVATLASVNYPLEQRMEFEVR